MDQALRHEAAHVVAHRLVGRSEPPHGPTWQRLVRQAGYEPTTRLPAPPSPDARSGASPRRHYRHRCPVCQMTRFAARPMPSWRCRDCSSAGLDGRLEIEPVRGDA